MIEIIYCMPKKFSKARLQILLRRDVRYEVNIFTYDRGLIYNITYRKFLRSIRGFRFQKKKKFPIFFTLGIKPVE